MGKEDIKKAKYRFKVHKQGAKQRNIPFKLTFDQWMDIWLSSGHYYERGTKQGQYCMSRFNDKGGYEVGNVIIQLKIDNTRELQVREKLRIANKGQIPWNKGKTGVYSAETKKKMSEAAKRRWANNQLQEIE